MNNPLLKNSGHVRLYLFVWILISAAHTGILYTYYNLSFNIALTDSLAYNILYAAMSLNLWYTVRYLNIEKNRPSVILLSHFITACLFIGLWLIVGNFLLHLIYGGDSVYKSFVLSSLPGRTVSGILYYFITILTFYLFIYYSSFREKLTREADLRALIKETELSLLRSQLNPHFIFNSLNSISSLTLSDPDKAQEMIIKLSSYLRYALEHNRNKLVPLSEELNNCLLYLDIEKIRFGEKLLFKNLSPENTMDVLIPNMILQPLLENAIKHGVYESREAITIEVDCKKENNFLSIVITNNFDPETIVSKRKGIGLRNVQERLQLMYGKKDLLRTHINGTVFEVKLFIPITL